MTKHSFGKTGVLSLLAAAFVLSGCQMKPGQTLGTIGGGAFGGLIGSTIGKGSGNKWAIALGAIAGAVAGGAILGQLDDRDKEMYGTAIETAVVEDRPTTWENPRTRHSGRITPGRKIRTERGPVYREVRMLTYVDGQPEEVVAYAYRGRDGQLRLVDSINAE